MIREMGAKLWHRLFPPGPDFLQMLLSQLDHGRRALDEFLRWCNAPSDSSVEAVFQIEKEADDVRRDLVFALSSAFSTPLDREDIDDISERLDDIVDAVRNTIREARALKFNPDEPVKNMIANLQGGLVDLQHAIQLLPKNRRDALDHAAKSHHTGRLNERVYTQALVTLLESDDVRVIFRQREVYSLLLRLSEHLEHIAEKLAHAVNKLD